MGSGITEQQYSKEEIPWGQALLLINARMKKRIPNRTT
jgi:hypothetical protein